MSRRKKIEIEGTEGSDSEDQEPSGGSLEPNPELEEALREAVAAVEEAEQAGAAEAEEAEAGEAAGASESGEDAAGAEVPSYEEVVVELEQTQDRLLRLQADFENFRRRALKERTEAHQYGHQNLVKDLLSSVDNLERAIDHARKSGGGDLQGFLQGVELVRREFLAALARHGVMPIEAVGKPFDPAHHEAMAQATDASVAPNTVVEELERGYLLRDRLLRPSRVIVARAPGEEDGAAKTEENGATD